MQMAIDKAVTSLPLEFRGNDPALRKNVETVIELLMEAGGHGLKSTLLPSNSLVLFLVANRPTGSSATRQTTRSQSGAGK